MPADESLEVVASGSIKFRLQEMGKWRTKWKIKINTVRLGNVIFTLKKKKNNSCPPVYYEQQPKLFRLIL